MIDFAIEREESPILWGLGAGGDDIVNQQRVYFMSEILAARISGCEISGSDLCFFSFK